MTLPPPHPTIMALLIVCAFCLAVSGCGRGPSTREEGDDAARAASTVPPPHVDLEAEGTAVDGFRRLRVYRIDNGLVARFLDTRLDDCAADLGGEFSRLSGDAEAKFIILDFESVQFFGDKPVETLMTTKKDCDAKGKQLILCGLQGKVEQVFQIMYFDKVFTIEPNLDAAVQRARQ